MSSFEESMHLPPRESIDLTQQHDSEGDTMVAHPPQSRDVQVIESEGETQVPQSTQAIDPMLQLSSVQSVEGPMSTPMPVTGSGSRFSWTDLATEALIDSLLISKTLNEGEGANFKPSAWTRAMEAVREKANVRGDRKQCENKLQLLKKDWRLWVAFLAAISGWGKENDMPHATLSTTKAFFAAHPQYKKFEKQPLKFEEKLAMLFGGALATGEDAIRVRRLVSEMHSINNASSGGSAPPSSRKRKADALGENDDAITRQFTVMCDSLEQFLTRALGGGESPCALACRVINSCQDELFPSCLKDNAKVRRRHLGRLLDLFSNDESAAKGFVEVQNDEFDAATRKRAFLFLLERIGMLTSGKVDREIVD
ncbi:hypothetical protein KEM55_005368 [Ascosphaera atra]|nr:hypothetical protein KEM55_005368 [Ascosphaera atra]